MATLRANDEGAQDDHAKSSKNSSPGTDPKLALLQDTWLDSELEVIELKARKRRGEVLGEDLAAAKKRRDVLWKQLLGEWKKGWKRSAKLKSKVARAAAPVEQSSEHDEADEHIEPGEQAEFEDDTGELNEVDEQDNCELDEEPPRKRGRPRKKTRTRRKVVPFTNQQKDHIRALICKTLGTRTPPVEEVEPVAQAAGLTITQVRDWIKHFYRENPDPTLEQAMSWNSEDLSYRDILSEWLTAHRDNPYPSLEDKERLARETGKTLEQVDLWFKKSRCKNGLAAHRISPDQTAILSASFEKSAYPSAGEKERLAGETGQTSKQVGNWFIYQRIKKGLAAQKELPTDQKAPLYAWLHAHMGDPYPNADKKNELAKEAGLTLTQVNSWFGRSRKRIERNQGKKEYEGRCPCCGEALDLVVPVERSHELEEVDEPDSNPGELDEPQDLGSVDESQWSDSQMLDLREVDESVNLGQLGQQDESVGELDEEPPRKRSRLQAGQHEARPISPGTKRKYNIFTTQQKDHIRALICKTLGNRTLPMEEVEPVAQAAGLTINQVRRWMVHFYRYNPDPTFEQAMSWNSEDLSYRDILSEWLTAHRDNPYPSLEEKERLAGETGKTLKQVDLWFRKSRQKNGLAAHRISPDQTAILSASFEKSTYLSAGEKERLAGETGLTSRQLDNWFRRQRRKNGVKSWTNGFYYMVAC